MNIQDLYKESEADLKIVPDELDTCAARTSSIGGKWARYLLEEKSILKKIQAEYNSLRLDRYEFYIGRKAEPKEFFPHKILKNEVDIYLDADVKIQEKQQKVDTQSQKIQFIENILKMIQGRSFQIRDIIEWKKFMHGR